MYWLILLPTNGIGRAVAIGRATDMMFAMKTTFLHNLGGLPTVLIMPN